MGSAAVALEERYTYGDYKSWDDGFRWELIDGEAFCMSPGPGALHQGFLTSLSLEIGIYFREKECRVFYAPLDVMLPYGDGPKDEAETVVQPDIMIVCDRSKIQHDGIYGAPDVVFEILSPTTTRRDLGDKFDLYERAGVKEYVIIDPCNRVVFAHRRGIDGRFSFRKVYGPDDELEFGMFPDLKISLASIWEDVKDLPLS